ncbi:MAG: hypothetical protein OER87_13040 [Gammaproteobacteria bacterium]|nr:hypothetical protein [Gammaproteobacteria bacterium]
MQTDILIVGAGLSGLTRASALARRGAFAPGCWSRRGPRIDCRIEAVSLLD